MSELSLGTRAAIGAMTAGPELAPAEATKRFRYSTLAPAGPLREKLEAIEKEFDNDDLRLSLKSVEAIIEFKLRSATEAFMKVESGLLDVDPAKDGDAARKNEEIRRIARATLDYETKNHSEFMERSAKLEILRKEAIKKDTAKNYAVIQLMSLADRHFGQSANPEVLKIYEDFKKSAGALGHLDGIGGMKVSISI